MAKTLSDDKEIDLIVSYLIGDMPSALCKEYAISRRVFDNVLKRHDVDTNCVRVNNVKFPLWRWYDVYNMYASGVSKGGIMEDTGLTLRQLDKIIKMLKTDPEVFGTYQDLAERGRGMYDKFTNNNRDGKMS